MGCMDPSQLQQLMRANRHCFSGLSVFAGHPSSVHNFLFLVDRSILMIKLQLTPTNLVDFLYSNELSNCFHLTNIALSVLKILTH